MTGRVGLWADATQIPTAADLLAARYRSPGFAYRYMSATFGTPDDDLYHEETLKSVHRRHNEDVRHYFRSRPEKLITVNVSNDEDHGRMCKFLGRRSTDAGFPWVNKAG